MSNISESTQNNTPSTSTNIKTPQSLSQRQAKFRNNRNEQQINSEKLRSITRSENKTPQQKKCLY